VCVRERDRESEKTRERERARERASERAREQEREIVCVCVWGGQGGREFIRCEASLHPNLHADYRWSAQVWALLNKLN
jgi:hypothetical protein